MTTRSAADPSARDVLERWVRRHPAPADGRFSDHDAVADLFASYLHSYAYEQLTKEDRIWWEERWSADEEAGAFSRLFGPEWIAQVMDGFLDWFLIRKVMASAEEVGVYAGLCVELMEWLVGEGLVPADPGKGALERARRAAEELPLAAELGDLLYRSGQQVADQPMLEERDWVDEIALIDRIEPGALWFRSELDENEVVGPVRVPERAAEIARVGWGLSAAAFGRTADGWYILEQGNVYPS